MGRKTSDPELPCTYQEASLNPVAPTDDAGIMAPFSA
jgi:hypothetical protein